MTNIIIHTCQGEYLSLDRTEYINHHGILGQKWGVRRYQNKDGSLTSSGKERYGKQIQKMEKRPFKKLIKKIERTVVRLYLNHIDKEPEKTIKKLNQILIKK